MAKKKSAARAKAASAAWLKEFEHASETVLGEVKKNLEFVTSRITRTAEAAAETAAETTSALRERVTGNEVSKQWHHVLEEVEAAGDGLMEIVSKRLDALRANVQAATAKAAALKPKAKKKTAARKKAAAKKKPAARKKTAARKKASARKPAAKKKAKAGAKRVARKKSAAKKKPAAKRSARKKT